MQANYRRNRDFLVAGAAEMGRGALKHPLRVSLPAPLAF
jgi:hypothetical protein